MRMDDVQYIAIVCINFYYEEFWWQRFTQDELIKMFNYSVENESWDLKC